MYVYLYAYVYVYVHVDVHTYVYVFVFACECVRAWVCVHTCTIPFSTIKQDIHQGPNEQATYRVMHSPQPPSHAPNSNM